VSLPDILSPVLACYFSLLLVDSKGKPAYVCYGRLPIFLVVLGFALLVGLP
jgi:hypothetical protein